MPWHTISWPRHRWIRSTSSALFLFFLATSYFDDWCFRCIIEMCTVDDGVGSKEKKAKPAIRRNASSALRLDGRNFRSKVRSYWNRSYFNGPFPILICLTFSIVLSQALICMLRANLGRRRQAVHANYGMRVQKYSSTPICFWETYPCSRVTLSLHAIST